MMGNKVLITNIQNRFCAGLLVNDRLERLYAEPKNTSDVYPNGTIVIGRIEKIISGINAAFVSLGGKEQYFMSIPKKTETCVLLVNRAYDGTIKCGDEIVVQVTKQAVKLKQPIVDYRLTLNGTYCLLESHQKGLQISSKLSNERRQTIKEGFEAMGLNHSFADVFSYKVIVRTNAEFANCFEEIYKDYKDVCDKLEHLLQIYKHRTCFSVLYKADLPYIEFIKNIRLDLYDEIVTDHAEVMKQLEETIGKPIRLYDDLSYPLVKCYSLESKLDDLLHQKVWMKSGGFLVIEQGETLTAIDVNSGKSEKKSDLAFQTNLEAVKEIFIQIKARNISGMILIDFINLKDAELERKLVQAVREEIKNDYVRMQFIDVTGLGLMELTREKKLPSLQEIWKE